QTLGGLWAVRRGGGGARAPRGGGGGAMWAPADGRGGGRRPRRAGPRAARLAVALRLLAAEKRLRPRRPARLRGVDGSAVRPRDGVLRAGHSTADPTGVRYRAASRRWSATAWRTRLPARWGPPAGGHNGGNARD